MDLNYLYHRHQVSLFNADNAACEQSRLAHLSLVHAYAGKIEQAKAGRIEGAASAARSAGQL